MAHWRRAMALGLALVLLMLTGCAVSVTGTTAGHAGQAAGQRSAPTGGTTQSEGTTQPAAAPQASTFGMISGSVVAGPTCPVETIENPCPPKPVPGRDVSIQTPNGTEVAHSVTDGSGLFTVRLAAGVYVIRVVTGVGLLGMEQVTPGDVTVVAGQTTTIQIELDTGIR
jgi:hypothetical protein